MADVVEVAPGRPASEPLMLWEPYDPWKDGTAGLARYVAPLALRDLQVTPDLGDLLTATGRPAEVDLAIARRLFDALKQKQIAYAIEPWTGLTKQQVRHPRWLLEDRWGTCLDLAAVYAAMCLSGEVGPLLAVTGTHALVVLEPGRLRTQGARDAWSRPWAPEGPAGVATVDDVDALQHEIDAGVLVAIDIVEGTTFGGDFDHALQRGRARLGLETMLIDVAYLHAHQVEALPPPTERPTIRTYLPGGQERFVYYPAHAATLEALRADEGVVVLHAPQGQGKSTLARQLVRDAPFGAGWFLTASERQTLVSSLADADLAEMNARATGRAPQDRRGFSDGALAQLRDAQGRWIVVLDNADGDPGKITPLMPMPGRGQLLVVTTTNAEWANVPDVRMRRLPPIGDADVAETVGGELVELAAGRALLVHAFDLLEKATDLSAADIASRAPAGDETSAPDRGPAALWTSLRDALALDERALRFCLQMAYLPSDQQPLDQLEELHADARRLVKSLAVSGLITLDAGVARMHRLFGAAVRNDLRASEPELDGDVVLELATAGSSRDMLDRYGDHATLTRLDDRLAEIDVTTEGADGRLGGALHAVAGLLELAGHTRRSGETYVRAERHLQDRPELRADVLQSRARTVNQHHPRDEQKLREALKWAQEAEAIFLAADGYEEGADRCLAMQGLLRHKLAAFPREGETTLALLHEALDVIEEAHRRRQERLDAFDPELARSEFNLAGPRINLAQREPAHAREHLDEAERVYDSVRRRREKIYDRKIHPHIAACIVGLGYVDYYRALLLPASPLVRTAWLRDAHDHASAALAQRVALEGSRDADEVGKVLRFLTKVDLARQASPTNPQGTVESVASEASRELEFAAVRRLPSSALNLADPIGAWLFSPALAAVVAAFGGAPPASTPLDESLAWFEEFSLRWDYRAGKERNLVAPQDLGPDVEQVVLRAAAALGLVGTSPPSAESYDHVLVLGGLVRACMTRPLYAAQLLTNGVIGTGDVTALGGFRPLKGDELDLAEQFGHSGLTDEFDAMDAGVRAAFDLSEPDSERGERFDTVGASWAVREYVTAAGVPVRVVGAPSSEPGERRANTPDTYEWFASDLVNLRGGERILVVTSDIYVPYQHADALRMLGLPYSVEVDAVGIRPGDEDPRLEQTFLPHNYLQEIRSTIRALRALYTAWRESG